MKDLTIAVAQFEPKDGDKEYNLSVIEELSRKAKAEGAKAICFHELSITAYTFLKDLKKDQLADLAEEIPDSKSCRKLVQIAKENQMTVLAGLVEKENDAYYNSFVCMDQEGLIAKHRKIHPFISPFLSPGNDYTVFDLHGWKCGILTCYDNNVIENVRATTLLGADLIFAPHVTGLTPSTMPGRGYVEDSFWLNRGSNPEALRAEFDGLKGRGWIMRWLPARAYDNGVYYAFANPVGYDGDQLKNGNSMILDPYGEILTEIKSFDNEIAVATISPEKLKLAGGFRYRNARRPELYRDILGKDHQPTTKPIWMD